MNEIQKSQKAAREITAPDNKFKGFTLEEIRYQRALVALQKEFCKTKITRNLHNLQKSNPLTNAAASANSLPGKMGAVAGKLITGFNYLDYIMIGFSLFGSIRKVMRFFHRKKK